MIDFFTLHTLFPFLLVLAIVYGAMETSRIFTNRALKTIISVVMAFFAISNTYVVETINSFLPYVALFFIFVFAAGFVKRSMGEGDRDNTLIVIVIVLGLLLLASFANIDQSFSQYDEFIWFAGIIAIIIIFYAAYKTQKNSG